MRTYNQIYKRLKDAWASESTLKMTDWWLKWIERMGITVAEAQEELVELLTTMEDMASTIESWESTMR